MPLIAYPDARLSQRALARPLDDGLRAIGARLLEVAKAANAYGLAAVHIGAVAPVVVISTSSDPALRVYELLYNPWVTRGAEERVAGTEGSVALPGVEVAIEQAPWVEVSYVDHEGAAREARLTGFVARIAQHEIDQMNGVFFLDRLSRLRRDMAIKKWRKAQGRAE